MVNIENNKTFYNEYKNEIENKLFVKEFEEYYDTYEEYFFPKLPEIVSFSKEEIVLRNIEIKHLSYLECFRMVKRFIENQKNPRDFILCKKDGHQFYECYCFDCHHHFCNNCLKTGLCTHQGRFNFAQNIFKTLEKSEIIKKIIEDKIDTIPNGFKELFEFSFQTLKDKRYHHFFFNIIQNTENYFNQIYDQK